MPGSTAVVENEISRDRLAELLNEDPAREYQAIIGYVVYSQATQAGEPVLSWIVSLQVFTICRRIITTANIS